MLNFFIGFAFFEAGAFFGFFVAALLNAAHAWQEISIKFEEDDNGTEAQVEYLLDVLLFGETEEKAALITDYGKDVIQLEQRMAELAAADAARTKKHHERHAATPEH